MTAARPQGAIGIERACRLAGASRAGYYRHWQASAPRREETDLRDALQRLALAHRHYGHRRLAEMLRREGWHVNRKRILRLTGEDNLLCLRKKPFVPATTDSRHGWQVVSNLARGMRPAGLDQLWVADITYVRLAEEFVYLAVVLDAFSRKSSAGRWSRICRRRLPSPRWRWRWTRASRRPAASSTIPTAACNTPAATMRTCCASMASRQA